MPGEGRYDRSSRPLNHDPTNHACKNQRHSYAGLGFRVMHKLCN